MNMAGPSDSPVLIALFGGTGVGKSTFANNASGSDLLPVGRDLHSCTSQVACSPEFKVDGRRIILIDTPGFDDNEVSDVGTLKEIAGFMSETYGVGQRLTGIIYLHRISDNRMGGASARTFNLFRKMCGTDTLRNVVISTTMWSKSHTDAELRRETQLRDEFFKPALDERARLVRLETAGQDSAQNIIRLLLGQQARGMHMQEEIVDDNKRLEFTDVGKELEIQLQQRVERGEREIIEVRAEIQAEIEARGREAAAELQRYELQKEQEMLELRQGIEMLRAGLEKERKAYWEQLEAERRQFEEDQAKRKKGTGFRKKIKGFFVRGNQGARA